MISAVQRSEVPSCAPAMEYVAMPEGSSSAAPVVTPGPRSEKNLFRGLVLARRGISLTHGCREHFFGSAVGIALNHLQWYLRSGAKSGLSCRKSHPMQETQSLAQLLLAGPAYRAERLSQTSRLSPPGK